MGTTAKLAEVIRDLTFADLPKPIIRKTKEILLDALGCGLAAYTLEKTKIIGEFVLECGGKPKASIIGSGRTSTPLAAFANAELINALDYDPVGPLTGHVVPYAIPPSLAIAEEKKLSGKELITAIALALEIGGRANAAVTQNRVLKKEPPYYEDYPRYSYSPSIFGAVAGACKLLGLDQKRITFAMGIAGASTPVPGSRHFQEVSAPVWMVKYNCWPGWIAQLGTTAALLAQKGFTADPCIVDGESGFWKMYGSSFFASNHLLENLGVTWHLEEISFKPYPCCACNRSGIQGICELIEENAINPEKIEKITVRSDRWLLNPLRIGKTLQSPMDGQFRNLFLFALAPYYGRDPGPHWQTDVVFKDARVRSMMKKVHVEEHPDAPQVIEEEAKRGAIPVFFGSEVEIKANGKKFSKQVLDVKGSITNPFSKGELEAKYRKNATFSPIPADKTEEVLNVLAGLENLDNVASLAKLLRKSPVTRESLAE